MIKKKQFVLIFTYLIFLYSCNYSKTKTDKHPEFSIFPKLSNSNFKLDSLNFSLENLKYDSSYYYSVSSFKYKNGVKRYFCVLDKEFKVLWKVESDILNFEVDKNKNIYLYDMNGVYKYSFPWDKRENIKIIKGQNISDSINLILELHKKEKKDTLFNSKKYIDSIKSKIIKQKLDKNLKYSYGLENSNYILFIFQNKEYCIDDPEEYLYYSTNKLFNTLNTKRMLETQSNLKLFDHAVLGNKSSGNHFFFSFKPFGFDYYSLKTNNDSVNFKFKNHDLENINLIQWENPFNNKIIIHRPYGYSTYLISIK